MRRGVLRLLVALSLAALLQGCGAGEPAIGDPQGTDTSSSEDLWLPQPDLASEAPTCECVDASDCPAPAGPCGGAVLCEDCRCVARRIDFVPCDPGDPCALGGACIDGACLPWGMRACDDGDPCTADLCTPGEGCISWPVYGDCDDGNACSVADSCLLGTCAGVLGPDCSCAADGDCTGFDDRDPCTGLVRCLGGLCRVDPATVPTCAGGEVGGCETFQCDPATGTCHLAAAADGTGCDDGDPCTTGDLCLEGACVGAAAPCPCEDDGDCIAWDDGDPCTGDLACLSGRCRVSPGSVPDCSALPVGPCQFSACDPVSGDCVVLPAPDGLSCEDSNPCTVGDSCQDGGCVTGEALACDDGDPCTDDACESPTGCVQTLNTATCEDGNPCTAQDHCVDGACTGGAAVWCNDGDPCTKDVCDPAVGCVHEQTTSPCDDGNPCTVGDACEAGVCVPGPNLCQCATDTDCAWLDDGDLCTGQMICDGDACVIAAGSAVSCPPSESPCLTSTCDPATGTCAAVPAPEGTPCSDQDLCTLVDVCVTGACVGGAPWTCDDGDPCTVDSCDPATGCTPTPIPDCGLGCGDGACDGDETCGTCPTDCGTCPPVCGDDTCEAGETCDTCSQDCGPCVDLCGDAQCTGAETLINCHTDCAPWWMTSTASEGFHGAAFMDDVGSCAACHGDDLTGGVQSCETCHGGWKTNCTFCHGGGDNDSGAPPEDVAGSWSAAAVGAHTIHVEATDKSGALGCAVCHAVPMDALSPGHLDGDGRAEVALSDCAGGTYDLSSRTCSSVYCHGSGATPSIGGSASWTGGTLGCQSCHPNAGLTGSHSLHLAFGFNCSSCHDLTGNTFTDPTQHADCTKDVKASMGYTPATKTCATAGCHGSKTW